ncbi:hypothetical protein PCE1_002007 [Barthelona sp. PCE]
MSAHSSELFATFSKIFEGDIHYFCQTLSKKEGIFGLHDLSRFRSFYLSNSYRDDNYSIAFILDLHSSFVKFFIQKSPISIFRSFNVHHYDIEPSRVHDFSKIQIILETMTSIQLLDFELNLDYFCVVFLTNLLKKKNFPDILADQLFKFISYLIVKNQLLSLIIFEEPNLTIIEKKRFSFNLRILKDSLNEFLVKVTAMDSIVMSSFAIYLRNIFPSQLIVANEGSSDSVSHINNIFWPAMVLCLTSLQFTANDIQHVFSILELITMIIGDVNNLVRSLELDNARLYLKHTIFEGIFQFFNTNFDILIPMLRDNHPRLEQMWSLIGTLEVFISRNLRKKKYSLLCYKTHSLLMCLKTKLGNISARKYFDTIIQIDYPEHIVGVNLFFEHNPKFMLSEVVIETIKVFTDRLNEMCAEDPENYVLQRQLVTLYKSLFRWQSDFFSLHYIIPLSDDMGKFHPLITYAVLVAISDLESFHVKSYADDLTSVIQYMIEHMYNHAMVDMLPVFLHDEKLMQRGRINYKFPVSAFSALMKLVLVCIDQLSMKHIELLSDFCFIENSILVKSMYDFLIGTNMKTFCLFLPHLLTRMMLVPHEHNGLLVQLWDLIVYRVTKTDELDAFVTRTLVECYILSFIKLSQLGDLNNVSFLMRYPNERGQVNGQALLLVWFSELKKLFFPKMYILESDLLKVKAHPCEMQHVSFIVHALSLYSSEYGSKSARFVSIMRYYFKHKSIERKSDVWFVLPLSHLDATLSKSVLLFKAVPYEDIQDKLTATFCELMKRMTDTRNSHVRSIILEDKLTFDRIFAFMHDRFIIDEILLKPEFSNNHLLLLSLPHSIHSDKTIDVTHQKPSDLGFITRVLVNSGELQHLPVLFSRFDDLDTETIFILFNNVKFDIKLFRHLISFMLKEEKPAYHYKLFVPYVQDFLNAFFKHHTSKTLFTHLINILRSSPDAYTLLNSAELFITILLGFHLKDNVDDIIMYYSTVYGIAFDAVSSLLIGDRSFQISVLIKLFLPTNLCDYRELIMLSLSLLKKRAFDNEKRYILHEIVSQTFSYLELKDDNGFFQLFFDVYSVYDFDLLDFNNIMSFFLNVSDSCNYSCAYRFLKNHIMVKNYMTQFKSVKNITGVKCIQRIIEALSQSHPEMFVDIINTLSDVPLTSLIKLNTNIENIVFTMIFVLYGTNSAVVDSIVSSHTLLGKLLSISLLLMCYKLQFAEELGVTIFRLFHTIVRLRAKCAGNAYEVDISANTLSSMSEASLNCFLKTKFSVVLDTSFIDNVCFKFLNVFSNKVQAHCCTLLCSAVKDVVSDTSVIHDPLLRITQLLIVLCQSTDKVECVDTVCTVLRWCNQMDDPRRITMVQLSLLFFLDQLEFHHGFEQLYLHPDVFWTVVGLFTDSERINVACVAAYFVCTFLTHAKEVIGDIDVRLKVSQVLRMNQTHTLHDIGQKLLDAHTYHYYVTLMQLCSTLTLDRIVEPSSFRFIRSFTVLLPVFFKRVVELFTIGKFPLVYKLPIVENACNVLYDELLELNECILQVCTLADLGGFKQVWSTNVEPFIHGDIEYSTCDELIVFISDVFKQYRNSLGVNDLHERYFVEINTFQYQILNSYLENRSKSSIFVGNPLNIHLQMMLGIELISFERPMDQTERITLESLREDTCAKFFMLSDESKNLIDLLHNLMDESDCLLPNDEPALSLDQILLKTTQEYCNIKSVMLNSIANPIGIRLQLPVRNTYFKLAAKYAQRFIIVSSCMLKNEDRPETNENITDHLISAFFAVNDTNRHESMILDQYKTELFNDIPDIALSSASTMQLMRPWPKHNNYDTFLQ